MLRCVASLAIRQVVRTQALSRIPPSPPTNISALTRNFSTLLKISDVPIVRFPFTISAQTNAAKQGILSNAGALVPAQQQQCRTVIKFSLRKGKRKSVKPVIKRFKRLHWGGWIRTMSGRHKHMWKKSADRKRRLRQHVFVNSQQATLLDKMVTKYWKRPRYYINDPYTPYHTREELRETRRKPLAH